MSEGIIKSIIAAISGVVTAIIRLFSNNNEKSDSSESSNQSINNTGNNNNQRVMQGNNNSITINDNNNNNNNNNNTSIIYNIYNGMTQEETHAFIRRLFEEKDPAICELIDEQIQANMTPLDEDEIQKIANNAFDKKMENYPRIYSGKEFPEDAKDGDIFFQIID